MISRYIDKKTFHEDVCGTELEFVMVALGAEALANMVAWDDMMGVVREPESFHDYIKQIIDKKSIPDDMSFNDVVRILKIYLTARWEEYNLKMCGHMPPQEV